MTTIIREALTWKLQFNVHVQHTCCAGKGVGLLGWKKYLNSGGGYKMFEDISLLMTTKSNQSNQSQHFWHMGEVCLQGLVAVVGYKEQLHVGRRSLQCHHEAVVCVLNTGLFTLSFVFCLICSLAGFNEWTTRRRESSDAIGGRFC